MRAGQADKTWEVPPTMVDDAALHRVHRVELRRAVALRSRGDLYAASSALKCYFSASRRNESPKKAKQKRGALHLLSWQAHKRTCAALCISE